MSEPFWRSLGLLLGTHRRCPNCKRLHKPNEIEKVAKSKRLKKTDEANFFYGSHPDMEMRIVWLHTYQCPFCNHRWTSEKKTVLHEFEIDTPLSQEERRKLESDES
jgi:hypothetical protein